MQRELSCLRAGWLAEAMVARKSDAVIVVVVVVAAKASHLEKSHAEHVKSGDLTFECVPDIQREGALDTVMADVEFCCHVASPYFTTSENPLQDLIEPAVNGTRNVMASALKSTTLKRLTIMSSFASVVDLAKNPRPGYVYNSNDWDPLTVEEGKKDGYLAYHVGKTEAEKVAWEMQKKADPPARFDIATFCPPMIYGPPLQETDPSRGIAGLNTSLKRLLSSVTGQDLPTLAEFLPLDCQPSWMSAMLQMLMWPL